MKCVFQKEDGLRCGANAVVESQYCFSHDPAFAEEKRAAVRRGGLSPKPRHDAPPLDPLPLGSIEDVAKLVADTVGRLRTEPMTHQKANAIGYLCGVLLKSIEMSQLEDQLRLLQSVLKR